MLTPKEQVTTWWLRSFSVTLFALAVGAVCSPQLCWEFKRCDHGPVSLTELRARVVMFESRYGPIEQSSEMRTEARNVLSEMRVSIANLVGNERAKLLDDLYVPAMKHKIPTSSETGRLQY